MTVPTVANLSLGCADWTALDLTTRTSTNTKLNEILRVFSEIEDTPESIILLFFFTQNVITVIYTEGDQDLS